MLVTALSQRVILPGLMFAIVMLALTWLLGRFFCGWICPLGTLIDVAGKMRPSQKHRSLSDAQNQKIRAPKFFILGILFLLGAFGIQFAWLLDPIVMIARVISLSVIPTVTLGLNKLFIFLIQRFELYGGFYDFYRSLKDSLLGIEAHFFANSLVTFVIVTIVCLASLALTRAWCRSVCPLGALYSMVARFSWLRRVVKACNHCGVCQRTCRMGAIKEDNQYVPGECVLCMDCVYQCPQDKTVFTFPSRRLEDKRPEHRLTPTEGLSRRNFLFVLFLSIPTSGMAATVLKKMKIRSGVLRPPAALPEDKFLNQCVRCGNCMKVCITNGLQPLFLQEGVEALWTPQLVPEVGYCEYNCTLCGNVCPTGALPALSLTQKKQTKIGTAVIDHAICIPWSRDENCLVCEEHCPVADKAIKVEKTTVNGQEILRPYVDEQLCVGCGICQNKCPVRPQRAIRVKP
jgi:MauM/NapG family ferredoxin protein